MHIVRCDDTTTSPMARPESSALRTTMHPRVPGIHGKEANRQHALTPTVSSTLKIAVLYDFGKGGCKLRLSGHSLAEDCLECAKDCSAVALIYSINSCLLEAVSRLSRRR
jgi:hypothetical protein